VRRSKRRDVQRGAYLSGELGVFVEKRRAATQLLVPGSRLLGREICATVTGVLRRRRIEERNL
jgi:hypothetical protein